MESVPHDTGPEGRLWKVSPVTLVLRVILVLVSGPGGHSCPCIPHDTGPEGRLWKVSPMTLVLRVIFVLVSGPGGHSCPCIPHDTGAEGRFLKVSPMKLVLSRLWKVSPMTLVLRVVLESVPQGAGSPMILVWNILLKCPSPRSEVLRY